MMPRRNRAAARVRTPVPPRSYEIILSAEARRRFADFIMLLDTAERSSNVIMNARKKVKQSKTRDGPLSGGLFLFIHSCFIFMVHLITHYCNSIHDRHRSNTSEFPFIHNH
ncbi:hypothetical protein BH09DEP1_BH09DEP1_6330 [soil metagenome]